MDNLDDSENNAKISDSAYSNSCSNSQSRRSHSSKSTHSGSNSSGSSGYGGKPKPSTYSDNSGQPAEKRIKEKESKKKKQVDKVLEVQSVVEQPQKQETALETVHEEAENVDFASPSSPLQMEKGPESMEVCTPELCSPNEEVGSNNTPLLTSSNNLASRSTPTSPTDGFSCVISMHDGVVMYTTSSLTTSIGFPKDMWIGRSFIDFVHPRDRNTFASHITNGLAVPKNVNGTIEEVPAAQPISGCTMVCRIRKYRNLSSGFGVKERTVQFMPFLLKLGFKNINDEEGKVVYLVIQATPFYSAFKTPDEMVMDAVPFVLRHAANGHLEHIDLESVPYLGYMPQDLAEQDAIQLYHPEDLPYLRQVYEIIVKEGAAPRSRPYRILAQNGEYVQVETEWSSFINPWSKKLEFVIAKHHIVAGPNNPDVFQTPEKEKPQKISEEEKNKIHALRESILRVLTEVLTKPAEAAKQQMTKRCQDVATFMESLIADEPKVEDELRLEIQDVDHSYYERDSVMLGGISPHHDNDSKSSTETPLSYNQLNYNETLQRYFDSHQSFSFEDYNTEGRENLHGIKNNNSRTGNCLSPMARYSADSGEISSSESAITIGGSSLNTGNGDYSTLRLTESLLTKHNVEMEKELMKIHRETRSSSKGERDKVVNENKLKKKEHLARCNAAFQPTSVINTEAQKFQPHGVKRGSKQFDEEAGSHKHHCASTRQSRRRQAANATPAQSSSAMATTVATQWPGNTMNGMNTFIFGVGIPQQMSLMSHMTPMPGMFPMYYAPAGPMPSTSNMNNPMPNINNAQFQQPAIQCMMYGQAAVYDSPIMYSPINAQMTYPFHPNMTAQAMQTNPMNLPLGLTSRNYEEACKRSLSIKTKTPVGNYWRDKKLTTLKLDQGSSDSISSTALDRSTEAVPYTMPSSDSKKCSDEAVDRTDGESSYSSFYSSFFKTESGSAEESDAKRVGNQDRNALSTTNRCYEPPQGKQITRRKIDPPWMEQVCLTSELVYKYQIRTKSIEEVLKADKLKISTFEQPSLVNEQLGQLYMDLQLEGVAARLTLEESLTSSSSSGEESTSKTIKRRRKREYSKLVMIYEEDAPLPPPPDESPVASTSTG